ncbi:MAG: type II toxin-antitoxin system Phd/YefM family antitoxin [Gemmatimonadota bacterium]
MINDHGIMILMIDVRETIAISKFKATCLAVLERVRLTGQPVLVTRRGVPIAEITPPQPLTAPGDWIGSMKGQIRIIGDIVGPVLDSSEWEALRD